MSNPRHIAWLGGLLLLLSADSAQAEPVFTGKVALTGLYYTESDGIDFTQSPEKRFASTGDLGYADVRALLEGKRLWRDRLDLRLDFRVRLTGSFNYNDIYGDTPPSNTDPVGVSARGYLGGREYDLREAYLLLRATDKLSVQLGRMFISEADAVKIDGVRLLRRFGKHWTGGVFAGGYPNPYSRSLLSDYTPPCGDGVAGVDLTKLPNLVAATAPPAGPCQSPGPRLGLGAGLTVRYGYDTLWGSAGLVGSVFGPPGGGGPVSPLSPQPALDPTKEVQLLKAPDTGLDAPRVYLSWFNSWRPLERLDVVVNLVLDLYGSGGPQLTRLTTLGTLRLLRNDRLTLRLSYTHLSSLAINLYLSSLLYNRYTGATIATNLGFVENNLDVLRTARDEILAAGNFKIVRQLGAFADLRFRHRNLLNADSNPSVYQAPGNPYDGRTADIAYDVTAGLRDYGSIRDIRAALSYTYLNNYRAMNHIINFEVGRSFLKERLSADFNYVFALTSDAGSDAAVPSCNGAITPFEVGCFGRRSGMTHEVGLNLTANPWGHLFLLADYRFIALLTDKQSTGDVPTLLSHTILVRAEFRW